MDEMPVPEPPDVSSLDPRMMTAMELQRNLEKLFDWLHMVEWSREADFDQGSVQAVRDAANMLLNERRDRHADEPGFRGG